MNLNVCKEYRLSSIKFVSNDTEKEYEVTLDRHDRFYGYMKPHIIKEQIKSLTPIMIDEISIKDPDKTFFAEKTFTLRAVLLVTDKCDVVSSYSFVMKRLSIKNVGVSRIKYEDGMWILTLYELQIPYHTDIDIEEFID